MIRQRYRYGLPGDDWFAARLCFTFLFGSVLLLLTLPLVSTPTRAALDGPPVAPVVDQDFYDDGRPDPAKVELGRLLFFDKVLSGNRNISCATCHHPSLGSGDALPLSIGEGGRGLGRARMVGAGSPVLGRVPRNAQPLFFVGARSYTSMFHDGRVEADPDRVFESGFWTPGREQLPPGLDNVLAAQAMFPVLSDLEMAGHKGENEIATAVALDKLEGPDGAWELLARRLRVIPGYIDRFVAVFPDIGRREDITFVHAANAIAAFEAVAFRADGSPFDSYLRTGDPSALPPAGRRGLALFYGKAGCSDCHAGNLLTDQKFHAIAMPQIGPGKGHGDDTGYWRASGFADRLEDEGRFRVTFDPADRFAFRTPSLRNVELTGPWGHAGSYTTLEDAVRHHLDPVAALNGYDPASAALPPLGAVIEKSGDGSALIFASVNPHRMGDFMRRDIWVHQASALRARIAQANDLAPVSLTEAEIADLVAFLKTLTDPRSRDRRDLVPARVPSGLPVAD
ncbi:MAG: hypothetical protein MI806_14805 [Minwuiales bacterium]|nr:hypothetical protein [Minwuiales bacterium]